MRREWWKGKMKCLRSGVVYNLACSVSAVYCESTDQSECGAKDREEGPVTISQSVVDDHDLIDEFGEEMLACIKRRA